MTSSVGWSDKMKEADKHFENKKYNLAYKIYSTLASKGSKKAQFNLGYMYLEGFYVEQDIKKSYDWYLKSAKNGFAIGQFNVSKILMGDVDNLNETQQQSLKNIFDFESGFNWLTKSAMNGNNEALSSLGFMYMQDGAIPNKIKDPELGCKMIKRAVEDNSKNYDAQNNLGVCYGVFLKPIDLSKAMFHHELAAKSGHVEAQSNLGGHLFNKGYYSKNLKQQIEGLMWIQMASISNNQGAKDNLAKIASFVDQDIKEKAYKLAMNCIMSNYLNCSSYNTYSETKQKRLELERKLALLEKEKQSNKAIGTIKRQEEEEKQKIKELEQQLAQLKKEQRSKPKTIIKTEPKSVTVE